MNEIPDFIQRAIEAQGKTSPEEVRARMDDPELEIEGEEEPLSSEGGGPPADEPPSEQLPLELPKPITWEEFFSPAEVAATKRVRRGQQRLGPEARAWIAEKVGGTIGDGTRSAKQFVNTPHGSYRISLSSDGDNTTETAAHERMGVETVTVENVEQMCAFFLAHGLPGAETYEALRSHLAGGV